jgi:hypothetical protein
MKTLLISGSSPPPAALRDVVGRGSTVLHERRASDIDTDAATQLSVDRIVFWAPSGETAVRALARGCVRAERRARREAIVFVTPEAEGGSIEGLNPNELFIWPQDQDRLTMAFMTGA